MEVSPSARKVWIEMIPCRISAHCFVSPSARKVWIEMNTESDEINVEYVTFRKEGVD